MADLLTLNHVHKSHRRGERWLRVLVDVSLEIAAGEIVAVIGARREGKTTLLKVACGMEAPEEGTVLFGGRDLAGRRASERSRLLGDEIAWADGGEPALQLCVLDYVSLPLRMGRSRSRREAQQLAMAALERLGIERCSRARWGELSNWERVLVPLARASAGSPRLLVVDDLLDGLGMRRTRQISELLSSAAVESGCGILLSAADIESALVADRVLWFERGRLVPVSSKPEGEAEVIGFPIRSRPGGASRGAGA